MGCSHHAARVERAYTPRGIASSRRRRRPRPSRPVGQARIRAGLPVSGTSSPRSAAHVPFAPKADIVCAHSRSQLLANAAIAASRLSAAPMVENHKTFGRSGHIKSQRSCRLGSSRLGQSPFSCSFHFIMFPLRPYFSMSAETR